MRMVLLFPAVEQERYWLSRTLSCAGAPLFDRANENSFVYGLRHSETGCSQSGAVPARTWNTFYRNISCPTATIHRCDLGFSHAHTSSKCYCYSQKVRDICLGSGLHMMLYVASNKAGGHHFRSGPFIREQH